MKKKIIRHAKKQENTASNEELNQSVEIASKLIQILELTDKVIKIIMAQDNSRDMEHMKKAQIKFLKMKTTV